MRVLARPVGELVPQSTRPRSRRQITDAERQQILARLRRDFAGYLGDRTVMDVVGAYAGAQLTAEEAEASARRTLADVLADY